MSVITNVILHFPLGSKAALIELDTYLTSQGHLPIEFITGGGEKVMTGVAAGAFNHLDVEMFLARIRSLKWSLPGSVQVFYRHHDDELFTEWRIDPDWRQKSWPRLFAPGAEQ